jgi:hypothetical protein
MQRGVADTAVEEFDKFSRITAGLIGVNFIDDDA